MAQKISIYELDKNIVKAAREWRLAKSTAEKEKALKEYHYWCGVFYAK